MKNIKYFILFLFFTVMVSLSHIFAAKESKEEAQLIYYEGKVDVKRAQKEDWENVKLKMMFYPKDRVRTRLQSKVEFKLPDDSVFKIGENTTFDIQKMFLDKSTNSKNYSFKLLVGDLVGNIEKMKKGDTFEIETPVALVGFRGTTVFIHVAPNGETWVGMKQGLGYIRSIKTGGEQVIEENYYFLVGTDGAFIGSGVLSGSDFERFENLEKAKDDLIKKGQITPPKIISVEKEKDRASIKGQADAGSTINMVSSTGQSFTTQADDSGNFSFTANLVVDISPPIIKITTSEFGKRATNNRNLRIVGLVIDKSAGGSVYFTFTSVNKDQEKSMPTVYVLDSKAEGLKFYTNGQEINLFGGIINTSYILSEGKNVLEFRAVDGAGNEGKETKVIYLDTRPPNLLSFSITPGRIEMEDNVEILIEAQDEFSEMKKNIALNLYDPKGSSYQLVMPYDYSSKKYAITVTPYKYVGKRAEGPWKASVELEDELGNKSMKYFRDFKVIDLPPAPPDYRNRGK